MIFSSASVTRLVVQNVLVQKTLFVLALVFAIWLIQRTEDKNAASVFGALQHHEPSLRIFQSLLQVNLILMEAALSIYIWCRIMGTTTVASLLFQPIYHSFNSQHAIIETMTSSFSASMRVIQHENDDNENTPAQQGQQPDLVLTEEDANDANVASDGSVDGQEEEENSPREQESPREEEFHDEHHDDDNHEQQQPPLTVPDPTVLASFALDMLLVLLVTLFFFTLAFSFDSNDVDNDNNEGTIGRVFSRIAAPTFPLICFFYLLVRAFYPWKRGQRGSFWTVVFYTLSAPWFPVTFRDGFIGDIITSSVRPLQDICFTIFYVLFGFKGWYHDYYDNDSSEEESFLHAADEHVPAMEKSWIVHTVVLPMCMVSPLWWRFLQNLRQVHDERQRWPYLGNALKYFVAAQVAMIGVFRPQAKQSVLWILSFIVATLYQVYWDVFMDWELLVYVRNDDSMSKGSNHNGRRRSGGGGGRWQLRPQRLYPSRCCLYWTILVVNTLLRFCWTLSFIPLRYLNPAGVLTEAFGGGGGGGSNNDNSDGGSNQDNSHISSIVLGPLLATAEIMRRGLWGLLRFEWEVIKTQADVVASKSGDGAAAYQEAEQEDGDDGGEGDGLELGPMKARNGQEASDGSGGGGRRDGGDGRDGIMMIASGSRHLDTVTMSAPAATPGRHLPIVQNLLAATDMAHMNTIQVLLELGLYATTFCVLGFVAAYHRGTL